MPESPASFLNFLFKVRESGCLNSDQGPVVVHCSAGIGRSGTFCLVDTCLLLVGTKLCYLEIILPIRFNHTQFTNYSVECLTSGLCLVVCFCCSLQMSLRKDPSSVRIREVLLEMRRYRMGLIQTADQLRFSYLAVIEGAKYIKGDSSLQASPSSLLCDS